VTSGSGIYEVVNSDGFELCHPVRRADFARIADEMNGVSRLAGWIPIEVKIVGRDQGRKLTRSDAPWFDSETLIFRKRAIDALEPYLVDNGELLPLSCRSAELVMYNALRVIDALDEKSSAIVRFSSGSIMRIERYAFRADLIRGVDVFKIPGMRVSPILVTDRFVEAWRLAGLSGLEFTKVWSPD
jgi:hypothetical protein